MIRDEKEVKRKIIESGYKAIDELIKVANEKIVLSYDEVDEESKMLKAEKMKLAASAKKTAIFDAFEILEKIKAEEANIEDVKPDTKKEERYGKFGFAESRAANT